MEEPEIEYSTYSQAYNDAHAKTEIEYHGYLNLDKVLNAQKPLSEEPLEIMFIVAHQSSELWFKVLIQELTRYPSPAPNYDPTIQLDRIAKILEHLNTIWTVLATMTPEEYDRFRFKLGKASGLQSKQYKKVKTLLQELPTRWNRKYKHFLINIENSFKKYQFSHMKTAERIIGNKDGTGGTSGVEYLKKAINTPLFIEPRDYEWKGW